MTTTIRTCLLAVCALAAGAGLARASSPKWTDDQLAHFSDAIVTGRVTDVAAGRDPSNGEAIATRQNTGSDHRGVLSGDSERRSLASFVTRLRAIGDEDRKSGARGFVVVPPAEETRAVVHAAATAGAPFTFFNP